MDTNDIPDHLYPLENNEDFWSSFTGEYNHRYGTPEGKFDYKSVDLQGKGDLCKYVGIRYAKNLGDHHPGIRMKIAIDVANILWLGGITFQALQMKSFFEIDNAIKSNEQVKELKAFPRE